MVTKTTKKNNSKQINEVRCKSFVPLLSARIIAVIFILFISLFALEAFSENSPLIDTIFGFIMQLLPALILIGFLAISWKSELASGGLFILTAIAFTIFFNTYESVGAFIFISIPVLTIGILMLLGYKLKYKNHVFKRVVEHIKAESNGVVVLTLLSKFLAGFGLGVIVASNSYGSIKIVGWCSLALAVGLAIPIVKAFIAKEISKNI